MDSDRFDVISRPLGLHRLVGGLVGGLLAGLGVVPWTTPDRRGIEGSADVRRRRPGGASLSWGHIVRTRR